MTASTGALRSESFFRRHPVLSDFLLTFAISSTGALTVAPSALMCGQSPSGLTGILMFPAMLLGPSVSGIVMTRIVGGREGLTDLFVRMGRARVPARWFAVLLVPPILVLGVFLSYDFRVGRVLAEPLLDLYFVWSARRISRRKRMDWVCISENEFDHEAVRGRDLARDPVGDLAFASD